MIYSRINNSKVSLQKGVSTITTESKNFDHIRPPAFSDNESYPTGTRIARDLRIGEHNLLTRRPSSLTQLGEKGVSGLKATPQPSLDIFGDFS